MKFVIFALLFAVGTVAAYAAPDTAAASPAPAAAAATPAPAAAWYTIIDMQSN